MPASRGNGSTALRNRFSIRCSMISFAGITAVASVFEVDGRELSRTVVRDPRSWRPRSPFGRRRTPSATHGYIGTQYPLLPADRAGIAISTFGKVIKRGWDWLGLTPAAHAHISGLIEAPDLAACLTLSKNDFIRTGTRGASYLAYRKAIQEVVSRRSSRSGVTRAMPRRVRARYDSSAISSACSKISPTTSRCCGRSSIAAPEDRSGCRCQAAGNARVRLAVCGKGRRAPHRRKAERSRPLTLTRRRVRRRTAGLQRSGGFRSPIGPRRATVGSIRSSDAGVRRGTVCSWNSSRALRTRSWGVWSTARSLLMMRIPRSRAPSHRGRSDITRRSPSLSPWRP